MIWIAAHPGAGKSTLAATWLESGGYEDIWFQVDADDRDPAAFFHYLALAASSSQAARASALPLLTPEQLTDLVGFGRRFFRGLFAQLDENTVVVFDNFQEIPEESMLHDVLVAGIDEVPAGVTLLVISRELPTARYARLAANRSMTVIAWEELRLTLEETKAIISGSAVAQASTLADKLHELCDGWAAGLTLVLEHVRSNAQYSTALGAESHAATFEYFAAQVFDLAAPETQQILLTCAFLPRFSARQAVQLSGHPNAGKLLEQLYRRHLFTDRRLAKESIYQFHALFRDFLLTRAEELYTAAGRAQIARRGALVLEQDDDPEGAIALFLQAEEYGHAARLVCGLAGSLLAQGRAQTLTHWIAAIPAELRSAQPWLTYWLGTAAIPTSQPEALTRLEAVFKQFVLSGDTRGQALSLCGIMEAHFLESLDFGVLRPFANQLEALLNHGLSLADETEELRVLTNLLTASHFNRVRDSALGERLARLIELLARSLNPGQRMLAAHAILRHLAWSARFNLVERVSTLMQPLQQHPSVAPLNRFIWWVRLTHCYLFRLRLPEARQAALRAAELEKELPHHPAKTTLGTFWVAIHLFDGDVERVRDAALRTIAMAADNTSGLEAALAGIARFYMAISETQHESALQCNRFIIDSFAVVRNSGPVAEYRLSLTHLLYERGQDAEAKAEAEKLRSEIRGSFLAHYEIGLELVEAYAYLRRGDLQAADAGLRSALPRIETTSLFPLRPLPGLIETLFARALRVGIERELVRRKIIEWRLQPSEFIDASWPWPIKVCALGPFTAELDATQGAGPKPQRKVKELLTMIVAFGGQRVPAAKLMDTLWPDADGDAAQTNLEVYITRLRKFLGHTQAVVVRDGHIHLNRKLCWLDIWGFEECVTRLQVLGQNDPQWEELARYAFDTYRGHLLEAEPKTPWAAAAREKLRRSWLSLVEILLNFYAARAMREEAAKVLSRALAIEPENQHLAAFRARPGPTSGRSRAGRKAV